MWRRESAACNNDLHIISHKSRHESQTWIDVINIEYINNTWDCEYVRWVLVGEIVLLLYYCAFCSTISRWTNDDHYKCMHFCSVGLKNLGVFFVCLFESKKKNLFWITGSRGRGAFFVLVLNESRFLFLLYFHFSVISESTGFTDIFKVWSFLIFLFFVLFVIDIYFCIILGRS